MMTLKVLLKFPLSLEFQPTQPKNKTLSPEIPGRLMDSVGADIFSINIKHYLGIVYYHGTFLVIKQIEDFIADNLIKHV